MKRPSAEAGEARAPRAASRALRIVCLAVFALLALAAAVRPFQLEWLPFAYWDVGSRPVIVGVMHLRNGREVPIVGGSAFLIGAVAIVYRYPSPRAADDPRLAHRMVVMFSQRRAWSAAHTP